MINFEQLSIPEDEVSDQEIVVSTEEDPQQLVVESAAQIADELEISPSQDLTPEALTTAIEKKIVEGVERPGFFKKMTRPLSILVAAGLLTIAEGSMDTAAAQTSPEKDKTEDSTGTWQDFTKKQGQGWAETVKQQAHRMDSLKEANQQAESKRRAGLENQEIKAMGTPELREFFSNVKIEGDATEQATFQDLIKNINEVRVSADGKMLIIVTASVERELDPRLINNPGQAQDVLMAQCQTRADILAAGHSKTDTAQPIPGGKTFSGFTADGTAWVIAGSMYGSK